VKAAIGQCYKETNGVAQAGLDPNEADRGTNPTAISIVIKTRAPAALQQTQHSQEPQPAGTLPANVGNHGSHLRQILPSVSFPMLGPRNVARKSGLRADAGMTFV